MEIILVQLGYQLNETACKVILTFCQLIIGFIAKLRLGTAADIKTQLNTLFSKCIVKSFLDRIVC